MAHIDDLRCLVCGQVDSYANYVKVEMSNGTAKLVHINCLSLTGFQTVKNGKRITIYQVFEPSEPEVIHDKQVPLF